MKSAAVTQAIQEQHRGPEPENLEELLHDRDPRRELIGARQHSAAFFMAALPRLHARIGVRQMIEVDQKRWYRYSR